MGHKNADKGKSHLWPKMCFFPAFWPCAPALHTVEFLVHPPDFDFKGLTHSDVAIYKTSNLAKSVCVSPQPRRIMNKKCVGEQAAKRKRKKKQTSGIITRKPEQEAHTRITSDQYKSTMCIKCHVTTRVSRDQTLGECVGCSKPSGEKDCSLFDGGHSSKKQGTEEELRNPAMQTLMYEVDGRSGRGYKEFCFSHLIIPPSPQDRPALVDEKDTPLCTTLPLHMTGW